MKNSVINIDPYHIAIMVFIKKKGRFFLKFLRFFSIILLKKCRFFKSLKIFLKIGISIYCS